MRVFLTTQYFDSIPRNWGSLYLIVSFNVSYWEKNINRSISNNISLLLKFLTQGFSLVFHVLDQTWRVQSSHKITLSCYHIITFSVQLNSWVVKYLGCRYYRNFSQSNNTSFSGSGWKNCCCMLDPTFYNCLYASL